MLPIWTGKTQTSLHIYSVSTEPSLLAYSKYGSREIFTPKFRSLLWKTGRKTKKKEYSCITFRSSTLIDACGGCDRHQRLPYRMLPMSRLFQTLPTFSWDNLAPFFISVERIFSHVEYQVLLSHLEYVGCSRELRTWVHLETLYTYDASQWNFLKSQKKQSYLNLIGYQPKVRQACAFAQYCRGNLVHMVFADL